MATKPTVNQLGWTPANNPLTVIEPSTPKKTNGWVPLEPLPAQNENWILYSISKWIAYLETITDELIASAPPASATPKTANYTIVVADAYGIIRVNSAAGSFNLQLPNPALFSQKKVTILDVGGALHDFPVTLVRFAAEQIEGLASSYILESNRGSWTLFAVDGNWYFL